MASVRAKRAHFRGRRIYANFNLNLDGQMLDYETRKKEGLLNYTPIFEPVDLWKVTPGSHIVIDELDVFGASEEMKDGVDSYNFKNPNATKTEKFFKKRLRKIHASVDYTVQHMGMVPKRIREETIHIFEPYIHMWGVWNGVEVPYVVHYTERVLDTYTGEHMPTGNIYRLVHPVFGEKYDGVGPIRHITPDMLQLFDTDSDPFRRDNKLKDRTNSETGYTAPIELAYANNRLIRDELRKHLPFADVMLISESGNHSKVLGDISVKFPKSLDIPELVIEVKGRDGKRNGRVRAVKGRTDRNNYVDWDGMLSYDAEYNTVHLCSYYDDVEDMPFFFPVKDNIGYLRSHKKITLSQLVGIWDIKKFAREIKAKFDQKPDRDILDIININQ